MTFRIQSAIPKSFFLGLGVFWVTSASLAQETILEGSVLDDDKNEPLIGVNLTVKGKLVGTTTDLQGRFRFETKIPTPFVLQISFVGFVKQEIQITESTNQMQVLLAQETVMGQEVVISASRFEESLMVSPVSIEKMGLIDIRQTAAANFYDGLSNLKGVDMNVQSLTFKLPNTRGFSNNTNFRFNQMVDGIDNSSPGLSFAAGNIMGLSPLDVESVELLVGASSALYGPGGMNGTLLMNSKNPFEYEGLSLSLQTGLMHIGADYRDSPAPMYDANLRFARSFDNKFAFKVNASYLTALDWHGSDFRDINDLGNLNSTRQSNPGYDGVNVYGDDVVAPVNLKEIAPTVAEAIADQRGLVPGTPEYDDFVMGIVDQFPDQIITRSGWDESDLVDYDTENLIFSSSLHYKINDNLEAIAQGQFGQGTAVYTAQNRFSLVDFQALIGKLELKGSNFFVRAFGFREDAGSTYDAGTTGLLMNEAWKPSREQWYPEYIEVFTANLLSSGSERIAHNAARQHAENRTLGGTIVNPAAPAFPLPGTPEFESIFNNVRSTTINQGGALVVDKSSYVHFEGMYDFSKHIKTFDFLAGGSNRVYTLNTEGTTFVDEPGNPIRINEFGAYAQLVKRLVSDRLKFTLSGRYDKNEKFEGRVTPRFTFTYSLDTQQEHNVRGSIQTAFMFPPMQNQWVDLNTGLFVVLGGLPEVQARYDFDNNPVYPLTGTNPITDGADTTNGAFEIPVFGPERVTAFEAGYRGLYFDRKLFVDAYIYQNRYNGFLATQSLIQNPELGSAAQRFQTTISTTEPVTSFGWALGAQYILKRKYVFDGNISYNKLKEFGFGPGVLTSYNTPDYRINLGIINRSFLKNIGFSGKWRWQNEFSWESAFGVGQVPAFHVLDLQVSYKFVGLKSIIKLGAANALNQYYTTGLGNAQIGGLYYITWTYDQLIN